MTVRDRDWHITTNLDQDAIVARPSALGIAQYFLPWALGVLGICLLIGLFVVGIIALNHDDRTQAILPAIITMLVSLLLPTIIFALIWGIRFLECHLAKKTGLIFSQDGVAIHKGTEYVRSLAWPSVQNLTFGKKLCWVRIYDQRSIQTTTFVARHTIKRIENMWEKQIAQRMQDPPNPFLSQDRVYAGFVFPGHGLDSVLGQLIFHLPEIWSPTHYDDNGAIIELEKAHGDDFEMYRRRSLGRFRLLNLDTDMEMRLQPIAGGRQALLFDFPNSTFPADETDSLFNAMMGAHTEFGFVATDEEYFRKHMLHVDLGGAFFQRFIGYRMKRCLPGLYWKTVIRSTLTQRYNLNPGQMPKGYRWHNIANSYTIIEDLTELPDWQTRFVRTEEFTQRHFGVFNIARAAASMQNTQDYGQLMMRLQKLEY